MRELKVNRLEWDSQLFNIEVGEIFVCANACIGSAVNNFDLLVVRQKDDRNIEIASFDASFQEVKIVFVKKLKNIAVSCGLEFLFDTDADPIRNADLYPLAFEGGKYSRFKLDTRFTQAQFQGLYQRWVDNSLSKRFADKVFYMSDGGRIGGFVTIKKYADFAAVGLIAVAESKQGQGFGALLLQKAEAYCLSQSIFELRISTQRENVPACKFYTKQGYSLFDESTVKHYWRRCSSLVI
jgi:dTDP-4-amino-4,6-dideoxy-D-galactose acyltransferase